MDLDQKRKFKNRKCLEEFRNFGWRGATGALYHQMGNCLNLPKIFSKKIGWKVIVRNVTSVELNRHHITREQRSKSGFAIPTSDSHTLIWALYTLPAL